MANDFPVKRLLRQAGVSVLAGLLLSTAGVAEGIAIGAGEYSVDGGPAISDDPVGSGSGSDGEDAGSDDGSGADGGDTGGDGAGSDDGSGEDGGDMVDDGAGSDDGSGEDGDDDAGSDDGSGEDNGVTVVEEDGAVYWPGEGCCKTGGLEPDELGDGGRVVTTEFEGEPIPSMFGPSMFGPSTSDLSTSGPRMVAADDKAVSHDVSNDAGRGSDRDGGRSVRRLLIVK